MSDAPARRTPPRWLRLVPTAGAAAVGWLAILGVWFAVAATGHFPDYIVPTPGETLQAFADRRDEMVSNTLVTLQEVALGLGLATLGAIVWAVAIVTIRPVRQAIFPLLIGAQTAPKEALAPLLVIWFGFSIWGKAVMAALIAFFPILIAIIGGLERFDERLATLARTMGAGRLRTFFSYRAWSALPAFFSGLRLGVTLAVVGAVLGEYLGADKGLGYQIMRAARELDGGFLYASLVLLIAITGALVGLVNLTERLMLPRGARGVADRA
jgi:NitT/TauT family transport system permease protein